MTGMAVYLKGNVSEGFEAVGPFPSIEDALEVPGEGWAMTLDTPEDIAIPNGDYTLVDDAAWFTVKSHFAVWIRTTDEGVVVDVYVNGVDGEPIASTYAFDADAEDVIASDKENK